MSSETFHLTASHNSLTLAAALKRLCADQSWSQVRKLVSGRRVQVNGNLCLDAERKVAAGDVVKVLEHSVAPPATAADVRLVYVDEHLLVVQKPAGVTTLRHREETDLPIRRKQLQHTLDELVQQQLASHLGIALSTNPKRQRGTSDIKPTSQRGPSSFSRRQRKPAIDPRLKIRPVHRLDRDTSGLMVFARTPAAEQKLIRMFAQHDVQRAYVAVAYGHVEAQTIDTWLVRDRGDGLRGSLRPLGAAEIETPRVSTAAKVPPSRQDLHLESSGHDDARRAITHIRPLDQLRDYTVLECRLETGRTHQIRIHLSEIGHRLCGEKLYTHAIGQPPLPETSGAPRQALHAASLAFLHPISGQPFRFQMPLPPDLKSWLPKLPR
jgi:23S rRNA pseudouridine1911/1915/1917 synthase